MGITANLEVSPSAHRFGDRGGGIIVIAVSHTTSGHSLGMPLGVLLHMPKRENCDAGGRRARMREES